MGAIIALNELAHIIGKRHTYLNIVSLEIFLIFRFSNL